MPSTRWSVVVGAGQAGLAVSHHLTARDRPRADRTRPDRRALAKSALGLAAAADPELDEPAARLVLPGHGPRRVHAGGRGGPVPDRLCRVVPGPGAARHGGPDGPPASAAGTWSTPTRGTGRPTRSSSPAGSTTNRRSSMAGSLDPSIADADPGPVPEPGGPAGGRRAGRRRLGDRGPARRRVGGGRPAGCCWQSAGTPGCPAVTGAWDIMWWLDSMGVLDRPMDASGSVGRRSHRCRSSEAHRIQVATPATWTCRLSLHAASESGEGWPASTGPVSTSPTILR